MGQYLLLYRSDHPVFGSDADLPGGGAEVGETLLQTLLREVKEELGLVLNVNEVREIFSSTAYSKKRKLFVLFKAELNRTPDIALSWEHSEYKWLLERDFITVAQNAKDPFMHMVADALGQSNAN
jgi:8-oxo-dGTP diphosphatase